MQKDVQLYQSQVEAGKASYKKMQADLQKELQSVFQENTRLTSLMEGKVPKGTVSGGAFFPPPFLPFPHNGGGIGKTCALAFSNIWRFCHYKILEYLVLLAYSNCFSTFLNYVENLWNILYLA